MALKRGTTATSVVASALLAALLLVAVAGQHEWRVPGPPRRVEVLASSRSATLWWEPPSGAGAVLVRGYTLSYGRHSPTNRIVIEGARTTSHTVTGLNPNTTYVFALTAYNEAEGEDSERVLVSATTLPDERKHTASHGVASDTASPPSRAPSAPKDVHVDVVSATELVVRWTDDNPAPKKSVVDKALELNTITLDDGNDAQTARHYVVQWESWADGRAGRVFAADKSARLVNLSAATTYDISVRVVDASGERSAWSQRVAATTLDTPLSSSRFEWACASSACAFLVRPQALPWTRTRAPYIHPPSGGLVHLAWDERRRHVHGVLRSPPINLPAENTTLCFHAQLWIKNTTRARLTGFLEPTASSSLLATNQIEKASPIKDRVLFALNSSTVPTGRWFSLNILTTAPASPFRIRLEVRKRRWELAWLAVDELRISTGWCPRDGATTKSKVTVGGTGRRIGWFCIAVAP